MSSNDQDGQSYPLDSYRPVIKEAQSYRMFGIDSLLFTFATLSFRWSLLGVLSIRPLLAVFAFYNREEKPSLSIWFPLQLCLYSVTLDFFFYIYHRAMHEVPGLWQFHSRHHRTKHPNALLGAFADVPQEWGDIAVIPVLTWLVLRYDFSTWYMCNVYSLYTEAFGEFLLSFKVRSRDLRIHRLKSISFFRHRFSHLSFQVTLESDFIGKRQLQVHS